MFVCVCVCGPAELQPLASEAPSTHPSLHPPHQPTNRPLQHHQNQVRIAAAFYDASSGETRTTQDASRTHKRKHHINSLAIQAAEREAELMEGRARGMLTKAQTQGKYGW